MGVLLCGLVILNAALAVFCASVGTWWAAVTFTCLAAMLLGAALMSARDSTKVLRMRDVLSAVRDPERPTRQRIGTALTNLAASVLVLITTLRIVGIVDEQTRLRSPTSSGTLPSVHRRQRRRGLENRHDVPLAGILADLLLSEGKRDSFETQR